MGKTREYKKHSHNPLLLFVLYFAVVILRKMF